MEKGATIVEFDLTTIEEWDEETLWRCKLYVRQKVLKALMYNDYKALQIWGWIEEAVVEAMKK